MSDELKYEVAFELISLAGDAKKDAFAAIEAARNKDFELAKQSIRTSDEKMRGAHEHQMSLVRQEANGTPVELSIMLVHAQDHLTMAIMMRDMAEELVRVYEFLHQLDD